MTITSAPPLQAPASAQPSAFPAVWSLGLVAAAAWAGVGALTLLLPNQVEGFTEWVYTREFGLVALALAALLAAVALLAPLTGRAGRALQATLRPAGAWLVALALIFGAWELLTAKLAWLPTPFFAPPTALAEVYTDDWRRLGDSAFNSVKLLAFGVAWGASVGFLIGVAMGWSRLVGYWAHPVIRFLGPVPASALL
ncbi:MAG: ABC transporter permease, partial [Aquincola tertiaricarbonis]